MMIIIIIIKIIIIIERRDYGGVLSEDCEDTEQSSEKVSKVCVSVLRTRNCQTRPKLSCRIALANSSVFRFLLNVDSDGDEVTEEGKLFHTRVAATGKARSPTMERRVWGTVSASEEDERRRRRLSRSATRWRSLAR